MVTPNYIRKQTFLEGIEPPKNPKILKKDDPDKFILTTIGVEVKTFDLKEEEQAAEYAKILADCANKKLEIMFLSRHWDEESRSMRAYLEWRRHALN